MRIKETICRLCRHEKTSFGFIYPNDCIPICKQCIKFIKSLKKKDYCFTSKSEQGEND